MSESSHAYAEKTAIDLDALEQGIRNRTYEIGYGDSTVLRLIELARAGRKALEQIIEEREHNPKSDPGICDECAIPLPGHEQWCAAAIAREALLS